MFFDESPRAGRVIALARGLAAGGAYCLYQFDKGLGVVAELSRHSQRVGALAVMNGYNATGSADDTLRVWDRSLTRRRVRGSQNTTKR